MYIFEILENECIRQGLDPMDLSIDEIIQTASNILFNFDYEMYNNSYKKILEHKFIMRNYEKQIGYETIFSFKRALRSKLSEILPRYNRLYELDEQKINYFIGQRYEEELVRTNSGKEDVTTKEESDKDVLNDRKMDNVDSAEMTAGTKMEECNKTNNESKIDNQQEVAMKDKGEDRGQVINKDRPENSAADDIKYASDTSHTIDKTENQHDGITVDDNKIVDKGTHGSKRTDSSFQDNDSKSSTAENVKTKEDFIKDYTSSMDNSSLEEYLLTKVDNNANGMIDRISDYVYKIRDTDELVLNELDELFSSLWGW